MAETEQFLLRFWGVRGSYPTPGAHTVRHGGNTSCIEVRAGSHTLILDAGSGLIHLGEDLLERANGNTLHATILITHAHTDHLIGIPFFAPLFESQAHINFFGPALAGRTIEQIITPIMSPPYFPVEMRKLPSERTFHTLRDDQCITWSRYDGDEPTIINGQEQEQRRDTDLCVFAKFTQSHPLNGAILYRIEYAGRCVVYATDVEWQGTIDPAFLTFAQGANVLIHDAQYTTEDYQKTKHGFGHSTVDMAISVANEAHVQQLVLFHHEPTYDDAKLDRMEQEAQQRFAHSYAAYEGMEIHL